MIIDPNDLTPKQMYKLLIGSVVPRPVAWTSTVNRDGLYNIAPFSFFTVASRQPPMLCISIGPGDGEREGTIKDTLINIRSQKEFVINVVSLPLANQMQKTSEAFGADKDEFTEAGLTAEKSVIVKPPRIKEAAIQMECKLEQIIPLGSDHLVIGRLLKYHIRDDLYYENGKVDLEGLKPVGRLAGNYTVVEKLFKLPHSDLDSLVSK
ncbi:MAG TPA: flavin reductase family protein [Bacillales bacterium]|nr:flavin reductase family protein [Bacillales bacterium]